MKVEMSPAETSLFEAFLSESRNYLEFGSGGSTCLAAGLVKERIKSVDSSSEWLDTVRAKTDSQRVHLHFVDIGPVGNWGVPIGDDFKPRWPAYSQSIWHDAPEAAASDLYLIDGRFRVACFAEAIVRARPGAIILFHDFTNRPGYHVAKRLAPIIASRDTLVAFIKDQRSDIAAAAELAKEYRTIPH